ncbi:hypothetical protein B0H14DRAFT_2387068, partial [Mycena olivaceomarginata]
FQGVLTVQAYIYYESFPDDLRRVKLLATKLTGAFISGLRHKGLLDATHLVLISQSCYHYLVTNWGNGPALLVATHSLDLHLIFVGTATLLCQGFFLHRIWMFSRHNWMLTGILTAACLATFCNGDPFICTDLAGAERRIFQRPHRRSVALFALGGVVDVAIAVVLVVYLQQGKTHFDRTNFVVARVVHYTVATGLATRYRISELDRYASKPSHSVLAIGCLAAVRSAPINQQCALKQGF